MLISVQGIAVCTTRALRTILHFKGYESIYGEQTVLLFKLPYIHFLGKLSVLRFIFLGKICGTQDQEHRKKIMDICKLP